jgi:hypothetical protein
MRPLPATLLIGLAMVLLAGCVVAPTPTPEPTASPTIEPSPSPPTTEPPSATAAPSPTATPEPALGLDLPIEADRRVVKVTVEPAVGADGGEIVVTVTSRAEEMVDELVLRWPHALNRILFLRPFEPSEQRIADGGPPLVQQWTKWVLGPGEEGEPTGTVSLGWGPLLPGATLTIPIDVVRRADGPVEFDLQVLADNAILTVPNGHPAELRVKVP